MRPAPTAHAPTRACLHPPRAPCFMNGHKKTKVKPWRPRGIPGIRAEGTDITTFWVVLSKRSPKNHKSPGGRVKSNGYIFRPQNPQVHKVCRPLFPHSKKKRHKKSRKRSETAPGWRFLAGSCWEKPQVGGKRCALFAADWRRFLGCASLASRHPRLTSLFPSLPFLPLPFLLSPVSSVCPQLRVLQGDVHGVDRVSVSLVPRECSSFQVMCCCVDVTNVFGCLSSVLQHRAGGTSGPWVRDGLFRPRGGLAEPGAWFPGPCMFVDADGGVKARAREERSSARSRGCVLGTREGLENHDIVDTGTGKCTAMDWSGVKDGSQHDP